MQAGASSSTAQDPLSHPPATASFSGNAAPALDTSPSTSTGCGPTHQGPGHRTGAPGSSSGRHHHHGHGRTHAQEPEHNIFVGDLALDVTADHLVSVFRDPSIGIQLPQSQDEPVRTVQPFPSCKGARIMCDSETNVSRGYGFVRFGDEMEMLRALMEMQGVYCRGRPSKCLVCLRVSRQSKGALSSAFHLCANYTVPFSSFDGLTSL